MTFSPDHSPVASTSTVDHRSVSHHRLSRPLARISILITVVILFFISRSITQSGLTADDALFGTYPTVWNDSGSLTLHDGFFEGDLFDGRSAARLKADLFGFAIKNIDGEGGNDVAAILVSRPGDRSAFYNLHVFTNQEGQAVHAGNVFLGENIDVECLLINDSKLTLRWHTYESQLGLAGYSRTPIEKIFELKYGSLTEVVSP